MTHLSKIYSITILAFAVLIFSSCGKNEEDIAVVEVTEEEAVEIITSSLQSNQGGITSNTQDVAEQTAAISTSNGICGTPYEDTIEKDYQGALVQASYNSDFLFDFSCNSLGIPQASTFTISTAANFSTSKMNSDDNAVFTGNINGIQPSASSLNLNGNYNRNGTQELGLAEPKSISSTFAVDLVDLEINKQSYIIASGNGTFTLSGSTTNTTFSYSGMIVFNGNKTATLTIEDETFEIDWN